MVKRVFALVVIVALAGCSAIVGDEQRKTENDGNGEAGIASGADGGAPGEDAAPAPSADASTPPPADAASAPDAPSSCTPSMCLQAATSCAGMCKTQQIQCTNGCMGGDKGDGSACVNDCQTKLSQCQSACASHCDDCATKAMCPSLSACAAAVQ